MTEWDRQSRFYVGGSDMFLKTIGYEDEGVHEVRDCQECGAIVDEYSLDKHSEWHDSLMSVQVSS